MRKQDWLGAPSLRHYIIGLAGVGAVVLTLTAYLAAVRLVREAMVAAPLFVAASLLLALSVVLGLAAAASLGRLTSAARLLAQGADVQVDPARERLREARRLAQALVALRDHHGERRQRLEELALTEERFRVIFERSPIGICTLTRDGDILSANHALASMLGYTRRKLTELNFEAITHPEYRDENRRLYSEVADRQRDRFAYEKRYVRADGSVFWGSLTVTGVYDSSGHLSHFVAMIEDISARRARQEELETRALHDALTGAANRALLEDRAGQALADTRRWGGGFAVLLLDLDQFKPVNDHYGHLAGDAVLVEVAGRLRAATRAVDTVARLGGDEFALLLDGTSTDDEVSVAAAKIRDLFRKPFELPGGATCQVGASIGWAIHPRDGSELQALLDAADHAMYHQKDSRRRAAR